MSILAARSMSQMDMQMPQMANPVAQVRLKIAPQRARLQLAAPSDDTPQETSMKYLRNGFTLLAFAVCAIVAPAQAQDKLRLTIANGIAPTIPTHWWFTDFI